MPISKEDCEYIRSNNYLKKRRECLITYMKNCIKNSIREKCNPNKTTASNLYNVYCGFIPHSVPINNFLESIAKNATPSEQTYTSESKENERLN